MSLWHNLAELFEHIALPEHDDPVAVPCCTVTVRKGDSLWAIAEKLTGNGNRWPELAAANADKIFDHAYTIQPGEVLSLPCAWLDELAAKG